MPGVTVQLRGPKGEQTQVTDAGGQYSFPALAPGKYDILVTARDFKVEQRQTFDVSGVTVLNFQLALQSQSQVITVQEDVSALSVDPGSNANATVLDKSELDALSDDPDELAQQLQALAGPGAGPQGSGQIVTNGFTGGVPPKSSIREVRVNSNPFSAEFDFPGFGRVEILTKPGSDTFHGQFSVQYNNENFNTRSPLYVRSSSLPPFKTLLWNGATTGPLKKGKASFTFDFDHREITENAFIFATNLDTNLKPQAVNEAMLKPQGFTRLVPRLDLAVNANHALVIRYENTRQKLDNLGAGGFRLGQTAFNQNLATHVLQITETAVVTPKLVNETRFQYSRSAAANSGAGSAPAIVVQDAFTSGSATVGDSSNVTNRFELSNLSILNHNRHTLKWGFRLRGSINNDRWFNNFNGTFTFYGGAGLALDVNNQPVPGTFIGVPRYTTSRRDWRTRPATVPPCNVRRCSIFPQTRARDRRRSTRRNSDASTSSLRRARRPSVETMPAARVMPT
ncbi:MAG TPA: carboxypeptidase-like regulatory domain-containing protein [Terriglobia bacterium]|nr:carboxypeptidase-like regulatory domain-containing protein [Terriglobia bacterium]